MLRIGSACEPSSGPAARSRQSALRRADLRFIAYDMLTAWDFVTVVLSGEIAALVYISLAGSEYADPERYSQLRRFALLGGVLAVFALRDVRTRMDLDAISFNHLMSRTAQRFVAFVCLLLLAGFLTQMLRTTPRLWLTGWVAAAFVAALGGRLLLVVTSRALARRGMLCDRVALVGAGTVADHMLARLRGPQGRGARLVATFDGDPGAGNLERLLELGRSGQIDRVVLALSATAEERVVEIAHRLRALDVEVTYVSPLIGLIEAGVLTTQLAGTPLMVLTSRPIGRWGFILKTLVDRVLAAVAVAYLLPVLALIALAIRLDTPGPVLFRQRRHGWNGTEFTVYKFRTMHAAAPGEMQTRRSDTRVSRVGRFLRHTSLDELPQLFNVLEGTMSLVGPRPHPVAMRTQQRLGCEIVSEYPHRHRVKPGITGWAQVNGHRGATETAEQVRERVEFDMYYIDNWSLLFDLRILAITPFRVLLRRDNAF